MASPSRCLLPQGIYTPIPTFFKPNEDLDLVSLEKHVLFTAQAGTFPVVAGSAGEAPHLTPGERKEIIKATRRALDTLIAVLIPPEEHLVGGEGGGQTPVTTIPIVAGVGAPSTRETIALARDAAAAGADFVMVIPPGYYAGALKADVGGGGGSAALREYFVDVAEASPVPVILYNFPAVAGGIDLDSELIVDVARRSRNVAGVKLT